LKRFLEAYLVGQNSAIRHNGTGEKFVCTFSLKIVLRGTEWFECCHETKRKIGTAETGKPKISEGAEGTIGSMRARIKGRTSGPDS